MKNDFLVSVRCISYNHASYIEDCMNGFTMQETTFPYVCVIDDDASTDGEPEVITNYLAEHFNIDDKDVVKNEETDDYRMIFAQHKTNKNCFFAVYFLKYNHYSIRKSRDSYVSEFVDGTKYMAICEGDDYWIDPLKLQKQVDFMQTNPECTLYVSNGMGYFEDKNKFVMLNSIPTKESKFLTMSEVLMEKGGLIPTASMCYRREMIETEPDWCLKAPVGDRPLRLWCAINGKIYYDVNPMVVYRCSSAGSFSQRVKGDNNYARHIVDGMKVFFDAFDNYTHQDYHDDVQYMKNREDYYFYCRVDDLYSVCHCKHLKTFSLFKRIRIITKMFLIRYSPWLYNVIKKLKTMF